MPKRVSIEDLQIASEWLSLNEGEHGEAESCARVAAMLQAEITARENKAIVRRAAKRNNVSRKIVRAIMAAAKKKDATS